MVVIWSVESLILTLFLLIFSWKILVDLYITPFFSAKYSSVLNLMVNYAFSTLESLRYFYHPGAEKYF